jgi:hypothetical protein
MSIEYSPARDGRRFGRIPAAVQRSGLSRSKLYEYAAQHPGLFRKADRATIVDFGILDAIQEALPAANVKASKTRTKHDGEGGA